MVCNYLPFTAKHITTGQKLCSVKFDKTFLCILDGIKYLRLISLIFFFIYLKMLLLYLQLNVAGNSFLKNAFHLETY